jgi:hypothetical protein
VLGIHKDDLEIFVRSILINPIRIQNAQIGTLSSHSLLCRRLQTLLVLELIDTLIRGFPVRGSLPSQKIIVEVGDLGDRAFAAPTTDTDAVDDKALLCFVAQATCLVGAGGSCCAVDDVELAVFPAAHAEEEAQDIRLLVLVEFCTVNTQRKNQIGGLYPRGTCRLPWRLACPNL